jgi:hypothetical protein
MALRTSRKSGHQPPTDEEGADTAMSASRPSTQSISPSAHAKASITAPALGGDRSMVTA